MVKAQKNKMKCRLCGNSEISIKFSCRGWDLFSCPSCSYVQIGRKPSSDEITAIYGNGYFASKKYGDAKILEWENNRRLGLVQRYLGERSAMILDAGCATGDFLQQAGALYHMWGYDISPYAVDLARKKNPEMAKRIFVGMPDLCGIKALQYDAICLWDVLEHLWDPVTACKELSALLKPGGYLFLSTPDIGSKTACFLGKRWAFMTPPEHMGFFSGESLSYLLGGMLCLNMVHRQVLGKWTNLGFLLYKLGRVLPTFRPVASSRFLGNSRLGGLPVYVPTQDIQYIAARKPA